MISCKAKIQSIATDYKTKKVIVTFECDGNPEDIERYQDMDVRLDVKKYQNLRSINANRYFWELCDKLAYSLKKSSKEIYRNYITEIPNNRYVGLLQEKDVEKAKKMWEDKGVGWIAIAEDSNVKGCKNMTYYYGSSYYDSAQMSILIDLIVQDCEAVGIPTATPKDIEEIKRRWGEDA